MILKELLEMLMFMEFVEIIQ